MPAACRITRVGRIRHHARGKFDVVVPRTKTLDRIGHFSLRSCLSGRQTIPETSNTRSKTGQHSVPIDLFGPKRLIETFRKASFDPNALGDLENAFGLVMLSHNPVKRSTIGQTLRDQEVFGTECRL